MATISSRLYSTGTLAVNSSFDEVTFNPNSGVIKNLFVASNDFSYAGYGRTITANATVAPDGTTTGTLFQETFSNVASYYGASVRHVTLQAGATYAISLYLKDYSGDRQISLGLGTNPCGAGKYSYGLFNPQTKTASVFLNTGGVPTVSMADVGNGWLRCTVVASPSFTWPAVGASGGLDIQLMKNGLNGYASNGNTSGVYLWGAQIEQITGPNIATIYTATINDGTNNVAVAPSLTIKNNPSGIYTFKEFDEVSYNVNSGVVKNLVSWSEDYTQTAWSSLYANVTVTTSTVAPPFGLGTVYKLNDNTNLNYHVLRESVTVATNVPYVLSAYVKPAEVGNIELSISNAGGTNFNVNTSSINFNYGGATGGITTVGNGWYRLWTSGSGAFASTLVNILTSSGGNTNYAGTGGGLYLWGVQLEPGTIPTEYVPTNATAVINRPLDGYRNLVTYSEQFDNANWFKSSASVTANSIVAPNGTLTADLIYNNTAGQTGYIEHSPSTVTSGTTYCYSFFAKASTASVVNILLYGSSFNSNSSHVGRSYDLSAGTVSTLAGTIAPSYSGIVPIGNGWYRCWLAHTATMTASTTIAQTIRMNSSNLNDGIYAWGYQIEANATSPGQYQAVTTANTLVYSSTAQKISRSGSYYVGGEFDEYTGASIVDGSLKVWIDAGQTISYPGTGTTWTDISGNGNNATLGGSPSPVFYSAPRPYSSDADTMMFVANGAAQFSIANSASITSSTFTLNFWTRTNSLRAGDKYNNAISLREIFQNMGYRLGVNTNGTPAWWSDQSGGNIALVSNTAITLGKVYNLAVTYDGTTATMYLNGSNVGAKIGTCFMSNANVSTTPLYIGGNNQGLLGQDGTYTAFSFYNRSIS